MCGHRQRAGRQTLGILGVFVPESEEDEAKVGRVLEDSPAAKAGIEVGDVIKTIGGKAVSNPDNLREVNQTHKEGDKVKVKLEREGKDMEVEVTYAAPQAAGGRGGRAGGQRGGGGGRGEPGRPYGAQYGGQREYQQTAEGPNGHLYGGVYKSMDVGELGRASTASIRGPCISVSFASIRPTTSTCTWAASISPALMMAAKHFVRVAAERRNRGSGVHDDQHALWVDPRDGRHIMLSGDGGTYITYDRMATWDHLNHMAIGQFYHVALIRAPSTTSTAVSRITAVGVDRAARERRKAQSFRIGSPWVAAMASLAGSIPPIPTWFTQKVKMGR